MIMIAAISIRPGHHLEFDRFYEDYYIPDLLKAAPVIESVTRFGAVGAAHGQSFLHSEYVTVYKLKDEPNVAEVVELAVTSPAHKKAFEQFRAWKTEYFSHFDRAYYADEWVPGSDTTRSSFVPFDGERITLRTYNKRGEALENAEAMPESSLFYRQTPSGGEGEEAYIIASPMAAGSEIELPGQLDFSPDGAAPGARGSINLARLRVLSGTKS